MSIRSQNNYKQRKDINENDYWMLMKILKNKERRFRKRLEYINAYKRRSILYFYQVMDSIIDSLTV